MRPAFGMPAFDGNHGWTRINTDGMPAFDGNHGCTRINTDGMPAFDGNHGWTRINTDKCRLQMEPRMTTFNLIRVYPCASVVPFS